MTRDEIVADYLARFFVGDFRPDPQKFFDAIEEAGFALVPREPTEAMLVEGLQKLVMSIEERGRPEGEDHRLMHFGAIMRNSEEIKAAYTAMLKAAGEG